MKLSIPITPKLVQLLHPLAFTFKGEVISTSKAKVIFIHPERTIYRNWGVPRG